MININLLDACENCPDFCAVSDCVEEMVSLNGVTYCHEITCENIDKCRALLEHLQKEVKKDVN